MKNNLEKKSLIEKKEFVIEKSADLFFRNGYVNTGLNDILKACDIAKGSFYYYFSSKDEVLLKVIDFQKDKIISLFSETVDDLSIFKLKSFFSKYFENIAIIKNSDNSIFYAGSPLGNLNSEMSNINEEINHKIKEAYFEIENTLSLFLQTLGHVHSKYQSNNIVLYSELLLNNLEGTCLKLKRIKNSSPIEEFLMFFDLIIEKMINDKSY